MTRLHYLGRVYPVATPTTSPPPSVTPDSVRLQLSRSDRWANYVLHLDPVAIALVAPLNPPAWSPDVRAAVIQWACMAWGSYYAPSVETPPVLTEWRRRVEAVELR